MATIHQKHQEPIDSTSPSQDFTGRHATDQLLRKNGYQILSREPGKEAVWLKNGQKYTQSAALRSLNKDVVCDAEYQDQLYHEGQMV